MNKNSKLLSQSLGVFFPFIVITGIYIIFKGHVSPGGGFQGGAILATLLLSKYFISEINESQIDRLYVLEKIIMIFVLVFPLVFFLMYFNEKYPQFNEYYFIVMNILIGIKVACGLSIIFFRFVYYEAR